MRTRNHYYSFAENAVREVRARDSTARWRHKDRVGADLREGAAPMYAEQDPSRIENVEEGDGVMNQPEHAVTRLIEEFEDEPHGLRVRGRLGIHQLAVQRTERVANSPGWT
jgi:hypothetical protein